jgi:hypothetical protein
MLQSLKFSLKQSQQNTRAQTKTKRAAIVRKLQARKSFSDIDLLLWFCFGLVLHWFADGNVAHLMRRRRQRGGSGGDGSAVAALSLVHGSWPFVAAAAGVVERERERERKRVR